MRIPSAHDGGENRIPLAVLPQNYGNHVNHGDHETHDKTRKTRNHEHNEEKM